MLSYVLAQNCYRLHVILYIIVRLLLFFYFLFIFIYFTYLFIYLFSRHESGAGEGDRGAEEQDSAGAGGDAERRVRQPRPHQQHVEGEAGRVAARLHARPERDGLHAQGFLAGRLDGSLAVG